MSAVLTLFLLIETSLGFKLATFNTGLFQEIPLGEIRLSKQIELLATSEVDVFCLNEIYILDQVKAMVGTLAGLGYPNSFSALDVLSSDIFDTPRRACSAEQKTGTLSCAAIDACIPLYNEGKVQAFGYCLVQQCPNEFANYLQYQECAGCLSSVGVFATGTPLETAFDYCISTDNNAFNQNNFNMTSGIVIMSTEKYPIINKWDFIIPSWIGVQRKVRVSEISICVDTDPLNPDCTDSIIVGCAHFEATDIADDDNILQSPLDSDLSKFSSHTALNNQQTHYVLNNIFTDNIAETLGVNGDNIYGVFVLGDLNHGSLFNRCSYSTDQISIPNDCGEFNIGNPFDLWAKNNFVDSPNLKYIEQSTNGVLCTYCHNLSRADGNFLSVFNTQGWITAPDTIKAIDHILLQNGYCNNLDVLSTERLFTDKIINFTDIISKELFVPVSDHYAIALDIQFKAGDQYGGRVQADLGECVSGVVHDCDAVDIDGYIEYCSNVFFESENDRIKVDSQLRRDIDTEKTARFTADALLQGKINDENKARLNADANLQKSIDDIYSILDDISNLPRTQNAQSLFNNPSNGSNYKDIIILILILFNILIVTVGCVVYYKFNYQHKYRNVKAYTTTDDENRILQS